MVQSMTLSGQKIIYLLVGMRIVSKRSSESLINMCFRSIAICKCCDLTRSGCERLSTKMVWFCAGNVDCESCLFLHFAVLHFNMEKRTLATGRKCFNVSKSILNHGSSNQIYVEVRTGDTKVRLVRSGSG